MKPVRSAGKHVRTSHEWFRLYFGLEEKEREFVNN